MDPPPRLPIGKMLQLVRRELDSAFDLIDSPARLERTTCIPKHFQGRPDKQPPLHTLIGHYVSQSA
jgi:hypothetical protein